MKELDPISREEEKNPVSSFDILNGRKSTGQFLCDLWFLPWMFLKLFLSPGSVVFV